MEPSRKPISTPWRRAFKLGLESYGPAVAMVGVSLAAAWLWREHVVPRPGSDMLPPVPPKAVQKTNQAGSIPDLTLTNFPAGMRAETNQSR